VKLLAVGTLGGRLGAVQVGLRGLVGGRLGGLAASGFPLGVAFGVGFPGQLYYFGPVARIGIFEAHYLAQVADILSVATASEGRQKAGWHQCYAACVVSLRNI
jgi:hypothetical protein